MYFIQNLGAAAGFFVCNQLLSLLYLRQPSKLQEIFDLDTVSQKPSSELELT